MPDFNVQAIVLRRTQFGETDNILTLYSKERGKFNAIAKGARKAISRLSGASELLSNARFSFASARTLQIVRQADVVDSYPAIREDLRRLSNGLYVAELLSTFVTEGDANPELFDLFSACLSYIAAAPHPDRAVRWFELQILDNVGYAPVLEECTYCGVNLSPAPVGATALSASQGGVLCIRHARASTSDDHSRLDQESLLLMQRLSVAEAGGQEMSEMISTSQTSDDLAAMALRRYIRFRSDRDLKSLVFLDSVIRSS